MKPLYLCECCGNCQYFSRRKTSEQYNKCLLNDVLVMNSFQVECDGDYKKKGSGIMEKSCYTCDRDKTKCGLRPSCLLGKKRYIFWEPKENNSIVPGVSPDEPIVENEQGCKLPYFKKILDSKLELVLRKNADYGNSFNEVMDKLVAAGISPYTVIYIRLADKFKRFETLALGGKQQVKDESILDTLRDLSNYADLLLAWKEEKESVDYAGK